MRHLRIALPCLLTLLVSLTGCETTKPTTPAKPKPSRAGEAEMKKLVVASVKLGDPRSVIKRFRSAKRSPSSRPGFDVYEIYKPNPQISMLLLTFREDRLWKMELRYFNGPTERTLTATGGWNGLRDILIKRFGPPVKVGPGVPQLHTLSGLNAGYARFNGVWDFPKIFRQMQYVALSDDRGGVGIVTFIDSTPRVSAGGVGTAPGAPAALNPGF
jgi:hypothetical protein